MSQLKKFSTSTSFEKLKTLKSLRLDRKISLRSLAKTLEINPTKLMRLEQKGWDFIPIGMLSKIAAFFNIAIEELIQIISVTNTPPLLFSKSTDNPHFSLTLEDGAKLHSYYALKNTFLSGVLEIEGGVTIDKSRAPRSELVTYYVLEGEILLSVLGQDYAFRKGANFAITRNAYYALYNPRSFQKTILNIHASPSFLN